MRTSSDCWRYECGEPQVAKKMKRRKPSRPLSWGEFVVPDQNQNNQTAEARWRLMTAVLEVLPIFFERLRDDVYPTFALLARDKPHDWDPGFNFEAFQQVSGPDQRLTPCLLAWARTFHAAEEIWILDGALQTLRLWHRDPESRKSLDISGFRVSCCVDTLSSDEERLFQFEHEGWDPQFEPWSRARHSIEEQVERDLEAYHQKLCELMESRGAVRARNRSSAKHFKWFALYQFGGRSSTKLLTQFPDVCDESTILKGVKAAADLLQWSNIRGFHRAPKARKT